MDLCCGVLLSPYNEQMSSSYKVISNMLSLLEIFFISEATSWYGILHIGLHCFVTSRCLFGPCSSLLGLP